MVCLSLYIPFAFQYKVNKNKGKERPAKFAERSFISIRFQLIVLFKSNLLIRGVP